MTPAEDAVLVLVLAAILMAVTLALDGSIQPETTVAMLVLATLAALAAVLRMASMAQ
jgi:hypothetical protein